MRRTVIIIIILIAAPLLLAAFNHYDVQARGNGPDYNPDVPVLRTPDARFAALDDFPFEPHYIEIEDADLGPLRVHYLDEGPRDRHVIVLLHGQATWSYSYRKMIPVLTAAGYRVVAPDLIGFGRSDKPADWEQHTYQKHVGWLAATLKALGVEGGTGFLFDWGGYFGLRVIVDDPGIFSRILLVTTTMPRADSLFAAAWVAGWRRSTLKPEVFPISAMVSEMTVSELDAETLQGLDAPFPTEGYKGGPRRLPMLIPATFLNPAAAPNRKAWEQLRNWDKPAVTLISEQLATRGFDPKNFHEHLPGTAGQPHAIFPDTGFFLIEDIPVKLAEKTIEFIEQS